MSVVKKNLSLIFCKAVVPLIIARALLSHVYKSLQVSLKNEDKLYHIETHSSFILAVFYERNNSFQLFLTSFSVPYKEGALHPTFSVEAVSQSIRRRNEAPSSSCRDQIHLTINKT